MYIVSVCPCLCLSLFISVGDDYVLVSRPVCEHIWLCQYVLMCVFVYSSV